VDLYERGSRLQQAARAVADRWTAQHLPQYAEHMAAGRVRVTADNMGVLEPGSARLLFERQQHSFERR
jgi:hypothetical protein